MRLLVDTNPFIEVLLNQVNAGQARTFLENRKGHELFVTDFALHSIGLLLFRQKQHQVFRQFLQDMMSGVGIGRVSLTAQEMDSLAGPAAKLNLDFDDALQALAAIDARRSRVVELRLFGGLSVEETAAVLRVSPETVMHDWKLAKGWLLRQMGGEKRNEACTLGARGAVASRGSMSAVRRS